MKPKRTAAKSLSFGLIYGIGAGKLAKALGIEVKEAKELMRKYFNTFPAIKTLMDKLAKDAEEKRYAYSPLDGRIINMAHLRWDHQGHKSHALNMAKNLPFQGAGASTTKKAMCQIRERIIKDKWDAKILITVHDEIIISILESQAKAFAKIVEREMITAFNFYAPDVPMRVTAIVDDCWIH